MDDYNILGAVWYTPPIVDVLSDALAGGTPLCFGCVAIETHGGKWKAYMGYGTTGDEKQDEQQVAANGAKVTKAVAVAHFPNLDPKEFIF